MLQDVFPSKVSLAGAKCPSTAFPPTRTPSIMKGVPYTVQVLTTEDTIRGGGACICKEGGEGDHSDV